MNEYFNKEDAICKFLQILDDEGIVLDREVVERKMSSLMTINLKFCNECGRWESNKRWYIPYHDGYGKPYCPLMNKEMGPHDFCSRCTD